MKKVRSSQATILVKNCVKHSFSTWVSLKYQEWSFFVNFSLAVLTKLLLIKKRISVNLVHLFSKHTEITAEITETNFKYYTMIQINLFYANTLFFHTLWKHQKTSGFRMFSRYRKKTSGIKWVKVLMSLLSTLNKFRVLILASQCTLSLPPKNIRKSNGFLMFSGGRERVHWEQMG